MNMPQKRKFFRFSALYKQESTCFNSCFPIFQSCTSPAISKLKFKTEMHEAYWPQRITWVRLKTSIIIWHFFLLGLPDKSLSVQNSAMPPSLLLLHAALQQGILIKNRKYTVISFTSVPPLMNLRYVTAAVSTVLGSNTSFSHCFLRVTASAWRMWAATCHCLQHANTTATTTKDQYWAAAPAVCQGVEEASQSALETASPSPPWSAPPNWPRTVSRQH